MVDDKKKREYKENNTRIYFCRFTNFIGFIFVNFLFFSQEQISTAGDGKTDQFKYYSSNFQKMRVIPYNCHSRLID